MSTARRERELQAALQGVAEASRVARNVQHHPERIRHLTKDDCSPVTVADFAAQAVVALTLREALPGVIIAGEEHAGLLRRDDHAAVREEVLGAVRQACPHTTDDEVLDAIDACGHDASAECFWTLDPIDGTKGFLRGQQYAIALALIERGEVVLGVMGCPNLPPRGEEGGLERGHAHGAIYAALEGAGVWHWPGDDLTGPGRPIRVGAFDERGPIRVCESVEAGHSNQRRTQQVLARVDAATEPLRLDSQCKYALVARGSADAYLRMPTRQGYREKIWDHAAGTLIARQAGAIVTDIGGTPLDFGCGERLERNSGIVCAVPGLHQRLLGAIEELGLGAHSA